MFLKFKLGFTLTELLVSLGVLGLIAAFAVPKVLTASTDAVANAKVHKAAQAVANGYEKWKQENGSSPTTTPADIMTFVNYSAQITDGTSMDWVPVSVTDFTCRATSVGLYEGLCYRMPDGAVIFFIGGTAWDTFGGNAYNGLYFGVDPDGKTSTSTANSNSSTATGFILQMNGRLRDRGHLKGGGQSLQPQYTPNYYKQ